jgi:hypothetical protein
MRYVKKRPTFVGEKQTVRSTCPLLIEACAGRLLRPLRDDFEYELMGNIEDFQEEATRDGLDEHLIDFREAARRTGLARKTLYEWKRTGKLRREHGLRMVGRSPRLEWAIFKACIDGGELS